MSLKQFIHVFDSHGHCPIHSTIIRKDDSNTKIMLLDYLLELGTDINVKTARGHTALDMAYKSKDCGCKVIKHLLKNGAMMSKSIEVTGGDYDGLFKFY